MIGRLCQILSWVSRGLCSRLEYRCSDCWKINVPKWRHRHGVIDGLCATACCVSARARCASAQKKNRAWSGWDGQTRLLAPPTLSTTTYAYGVLPAPTTYGDVLPPTYAPRRVMACPGARSAALGWRQVQCAESRRVGARNLALLGVGLPVQRCDKVASTEGISACVYHGVMVRSLLHHQAGG